MKRWPNSGPWVTSLILTVTLSLSVVVAVCIGVSELSASQTLSVITSHAFGSHGNDNAIAQAIVWDLRLPRVLTAVLVGAGLGMAGVVMQALTRNPLAEPYLLGLSSGASLGAVGVLLLGLGSTLAMATMLPLAAFLGAGVALLTALGVARLAGSLTPATTVLAGIAVSQLFAAMTSLVIVVSAKGDAYRQVVSWLLGSLAGSSWTTVAIATVGLLAIAPILAASHRLLDVFGLGDDAAKALGIRAGRARAFLLLAVAVLTGAMVSTSGAVGFVGLILPHLMRAVVGGLHRHLLPTAGLGGAIFLLWADTAARTLWDPREVPVGIVTALVGVPLFVVVLRRAQSHIGTEQS